MSQPISIGLNYRDFPENWRPALTEIAFAQTHGFTALQFHGQEEGLTAAHLGAPFATVGHALAAAQIIPTMELIVRVDQAGQTASGLTPLAVLTHNLPAITALGCTHVHWHLVPRDDAPDAVWIALEQLLVPQFSAAVTLAREHGFRFGIEHNEPVIPLLPTPDRCAAILATVPDLGLLWDMNHTTPDQLAGYLALTPAMIALHIADTPLPTVNHHLPVGLGNIDFAAYFAALRHWGFRGPATLEIGGLPQSGGYGRDTDDALIASLHRCWAALQQDATSSLPGND